MGFVVDMVRSARNNMPRDSVIGSLVEGGIDDKRIRNEIRFLTKEFNGDLTYIKKLSNCKGGRLIISVYAGNTLAATALLKKRKLARWEFAFMVVHNKARSCGLGSKMARLAMRMCFDTGCKALYITAERVEDDDGVALLEKLSPVARYWKRLGFRRTTFADFEDTVENDVTLRIISPWLGEYKTDGKHSWINEVRFDPMSKVLAEAPAQMQARMDAGISAPAYTNMTT